MVEDHKKNESEDESEEIKRLWIAIAAMRVQIASLKQDARGCIDAIEAMEAGNHTGFKHQNDAGWFD
jgi:hypothetical protein